MDPRSAAAERIKGHQPGDVHNNNWEGTTHQDGGSHNDPCTARGSEGRRDERQRPQRYRPVRGSMSQRKCATKENLSSEELPAQDSAKPLKVLPGGHDHEVVTGPEECATTTREEAPDSTPGSTLDLRTGRAPRTDFGRVTGRTSHNGAKDEHQSPKWMEYLQPRQNAHADHLIP